jgi:hypothetical protein
MARERISNHRIKQQECRKPLNGSGSIPIPILFVFLSSI